MNNGMLNEIYRNVLEIKGIYPEVTPVDIQQAEKILRHIDFSTPLQSVIRGVTGRIIELRSHQEGDMHLDFVKERMNFKGFPNTLKKLAETPYYGFTVFEKIYSKEDFSLERLEFIPRH